MHVAAQMRIGRQPWRDAASDEEGAGQEYREQQERDAEELAPDML